MDLRDHYRSLQQNKNIPIKHIDFLKRLRDEYKFSPCVIYDIGACILDWYTVAKSIWPSATFYLCDGFSEAEILWKEHQVEYSIAVLSDTEKTVPFYVNTFLPGGNSYYREIGNPKCDLYFPKESAFSVSTCTLNSVREERGWKYPDLVKMDTQGSELDIYRGAKQTLQHCKYLILELQHKQYNEGAPLAYEVIHELEKDGWELFAPLFTISEFDGDYCFINTRLHS
jgi:FkbM family methyltransferase